MARPGKDWGTVERSGTGELMGDGDRDLRPMLKHQLCPGNNRKILVVSDGG